MVTCHRKRTVSRGLSKHEPALIPSVRISPWLQKSHSCKSLRQLTTFYLQSGRKHQWIHVLSLPSPCYVVWDCQLGKVPTKVAQSSTSINPDQDSSCSHDPG